MSVQIHLHVYTVCLQPNLMYVAIILFPDKFSAVIVLNKTIQNA